MSDLWIVRRLLTLASTKPRAVRSAMKSSEAFAKIRGASAEIIYGQEQDRGKARRVRMKRQKGVAKEGQDFRSMSSVKFLNQIE